MANFATLADALAGCVTRVPQDACRKLYAAAVNWVAPGEIEQLAFDMNFDVTASVMTYVKAGRLRPLAVTGAKRAPDLPEVPTMAELGFKTFDITNWYGVVAPAGMCPEVIGALHGAITRILQMPDVIRKLDELGVRRESMTPDQFGQFMRAESSKYRDFAKRTGGNGRCAQDRIGSDRACQVRGA